MSKALPDITIFKPLDNTKVYISIIEDNFSRFILGWNASPFLSAQMFLDNLKQVYKTYLKPIPSDKPIELIVDAGTENNNKPVNTFVTDTEGLQKLIAQKDIIFSNSMIEAVNKTLKYCFLFQKNLPDFNSTVTYLTKAIKKYNNSPHSALNGRTPHEVFHGIELDKKRIKHGFEQTRIKRIDENRRQRCQNCDD